MKLRVMQLVSVLMNAGGERDVQTLALKMREHGCDTTVCCLTDKHPFLGSMQSNNIEVITMDISKYWSFKTLVAAFRLGKVLHSRNFDVVHTHFFSAGLIGSVVARIVGIPCVVESVHYIYSWRNPFEKYLFRKTAMLADALVGVSTATSDFLIHEAGIPSRKVRTIWDGIDPKPFQVGPSESDLLKLRAQLGLSAGPVVGSVGRLSKEKGHIYLLEAFSQVLRVIPNALLVFAGDGAEMGFLKKQVKTLGITSKVHFLGHRTDIPQLLHFLDVYVQPSLKETFSLAVCEAMMTGRPIVASAVEGLPDLIVHMQTGLLVAPGNSSTLASAIIKLLQNKSIAVALGSQARAFTLERFTDESMSGQFLDLYESILMKKRQRKSCR